MNKMIINILVIVFFVSAAQSYAQNDNEAAGTITLEAQKITVDPPKPQIALKIKEIKPREYDFFRSFEDEVKAIPQDMLNVRVDNTEDKIENLDELLKKERR